MYTFKYDNLLKDLSSSTSSSLGIVINKDGSFYQSDGMYLIEYFDKNGNRVKDIDINDLKVFNYSSDLISNGLFTYDENNGTLNWYDSNLNLIKTKTFSTFEPLQSIVLSSDKSKYFTTTDQGDTSSISTMSLDGKIALD